MAAITTANTTVGTRRSALTWLVPADRRPGIVTTPDRALTVHDLIAPGQTTAGSIEFVQEIGCTNNAAPVAETTQKPYSDITLDIKLAPVRTIAPLFNLSIQMLQDALGLVSYLNLRGTTGWQKTLRICGGSSRRSSERFAPSPPCPAMHWQDFRHARRWPGRLATGVYAV